MVESSEPQADPQEPQEEVKEVGDSQMVDMELKPCDESTDEYIIFCAVMDTLENLCEKKFDLFQVVGFRKMAS